MKNIELEMYKGFFDRVENIIMCMFTLIIPNIQTTRQF